MINKVVIGSNIQTCRKRLNLTQKELANILNVSYQAVSKWESGAVTPSLDTIHELAQYFKVSIDELIKENGNLIKDITYLDTGLNIEELKKFKKDLQELIHEDERLISANFLESAFFRAIKDKNDKSLYAFTKNNPGTKSIFAQKYGFEKEICQELISKSLKHMCCYGIEPIISKTHIICGNKDRKVLWDMATTNM